MLGRPGAVGPRASGCNSACLDQLCYASVLSTVIAPLCSDKYIHIVGITWPESCSLATMESHWNVGMQEGRTESWSHLVDGRGISQSRNR